jgi:hypothetical protein
MTTLYKIIPVAPLIGNLSELGEQLLLSARYSNDQSKIIKCINHPQERITSMFKVGFNYQTLLSTCDTLTKEQSLTKMQLPEWSTEMTSDL